MVSEVVRDIIKLFKPGVLLEKGKKVYAYDGDGKILPGWKFGNTNSAVTTPVKHFRVNNKDYIVFKDQSKIYIQNRRGETRINTTAKFENSNKRITRIYFIPTNEHK